MKPILLILIVVLFITGCTTTRQTLLPKYSIQYVCWSGASPGAGFMATSLHVVEIDLKKKQARVFKKAATHPEPMLPYDNKGISDLINAVQWSDLSQSQIDSISQLTYAWLKTNPPRRYNYERNLGTEDGYLERLTVKWNDHTVVTRIDPRGGYSPSDPLLPKKEWHDLIFEITALKPPGTGKVTEADVYDFFQYCRKKKIHEYMDVYNKAKEIFTEGQQISGYKDAFLTKSDIYYRVANTLKRKGKEKEGLKAVLLFGGSDYIVMHDIILVFVEATGKVVGVYHTAWGR